MGIKISRLKLLLADSDREYVESLTGYLMERFPYMFQVNCFTNTDSFHQFLIASEGKIDIILASDEFVLINEQKYDVRTPVIIKFVESVISENNNTIYKYCNGENLVRNIINIYEKLSQTDISNHKTQTVKILTIYSPAGGTGKTTIAANLSRCFARAGHKVFCLNLESINSLSYYFDKITEGTGFSKVLFALKENDENLNMKIKELTHYETDYNIGYFLPADSSLELDEVSPEDIRRLLAEIKLSGLYDVILVDLSSNFNYKNITVMEESNEIIIITTPEQVVINKLEIFLKDISLQEKKRGINFLDKMTIVMNRWQESNCNSQEFKTLNNNLSIIRKDIELKLPSEEMDISRNFIIHDEHKFNIELQKLVHKYSKTI